MFLKATRQLATFRLACRSNRCREPIKKNSIHPTRNLIGSRKLLLQTVARKVARRVALIALLEQYTAYCVTVSAM